jgi:hypothetical protein
VQVPCGEGVAIHIGPESCAVAREGLSEALTGGRIGQPLSRESFLFWVPTQCIFCGRQHVRAHHRERSDDPAWSEIRAPQSWISTASLTVIDMSAGSTRPTRRDGFGACLRSDSARRSAAWLARADPRGGDGETQGHLCRVAPSGKSSPIRRLPWRPGWQSPRRDILAHLLC